jgi:phosphoglycerol transferase MdoB-like AlkP superfamily enzyme
MRLTLTLTAAAAGALLFGLAFLLVPAGLLSLYGITLDPSNQWVARYFGSALLGLAAVNWLGRTVTSGPALRAILVGGFVVSITGLVVAIFQLLDGSGNTLVWSTAVIYLLLSLGYGDFVFRTPPPR